ncbi:MAG: pyruvate kinase, partial [candidate division NC10 bacterium]
WVATHGMDDAQLADRIRALGCDVRDLGDVDVPLPEECEVGAQNMKYAEDIQEVRRFLHEVGATLPVIAKLERAEVVGNLPAILPLVDAVMVARGDLGVEVPLEEVPIIQKEVIRQARLARVPVIVATQMLESMVSHVRPTRAEVTDVATAIFDAADAIMLSAETATGRFPVEAVQVMARIAERAERAAQARGVERRRSEASGFPEAVAEAACHAARVLGAKAIVAFTQSGFSARLMSEERPEVPIVALTPFPEVQRRLGLFWGVSARLIRRVETTDEMIEEIEATLLGDGTVQHNDVVVIVSGVPMWVTGATNLLKFHRVGDRR